MGHGHATCVMLMDNRTNQIQKLSRTTIVYGINRKSRIIIHKTFANATMHDRRVAHGQGTGSDMATSAVA
eukprot:2159986-Prymnesium_polylepis.1